MRCENKKERDHWWNHFSDGREHTNALHIFTHSAELLIRFRGTQRVLGRLWKMFPKEYLIPFFAVFSFIFDSKTFINVHRIGCALKSNLWFKLKNMMKGQQSSICRNKNFYPGSISAGIDDSLCWSICGAFDTWLLLGGTADFFPFLVPTGASFLALCSV